MSSFTRGGSIGEPADQDPSKQLEQMVAMYMKSNPFIAGANYQTKRVPELEVRFGTGKNELSRPISKIDYDNVVRTLYAAGWRAEHGDQGIALLRIQNEYYDRRTDRNKISNVRAEIAGLDLIQEYCRTNNLQKLLDVPSNTNALADKIKFTQKQSARYDGEAGDYVRPVDFPDMGFRVSYQNESYFNPRADISRKIIADWTNSKKLFRYLNRVRFYHPDIPIFADISIVKRAKTMNGVTVPQYTIQESGVLTNAESYEIELELDNKRVDKFTLPDLMQHLRQCIRTVLGALQETKFPIGFKEMNQVIHQYLKLIHREEDEVTTDDFIESLMKRRDLSVILPKYFVGPSSYTLQMENIVPLDVTNAATPVPNIRRQYTVTDKADGERRLLYVAPNGRVYMITPSMRVIFTGTVASKAPTVTQGRDSDLFDTLLDGEFIALDKYGKALNLYMAFDIYYVKGKSVRKEGFYPIQPEERERMLNQIHKPKTGEDVVPYRFLYLSSYLQWIKLQSVTHLSTAKTNTGLPASTNERLCGFELQKKNFYVADGDQIFESCNMILTKVREGVFPYNTDGLIFTPAMTGVGADRVGAASKARKETWSHSFKWKPPEYNTIDFLVTVKKDKRGHDETKYLYEEGRTFHTAANNLPQYKTLILKCGFDPKKHGYLNPCHDVLNDHLPAGRNDAGANEDDEKYKPVPFQPTDPYDPNACFCHVLLHDVGKGDGVMMTEEKEYFEENTIVEFKYDMAREGAWKWVPLRVRNDKTGELRSGQKNYGNSYHVANSNWMSIHHPITEAMITTGENIPTESYTIHDVYYNRKTRDSNTQALRNFHNLYVKSSLIVAVANPEDRLIDFACGKAGDLSKWRKAKLRFVLGLDIARDNIMNQMDGACARYLGDCRRYGAETMPRCLFFVGDSGKNLRNTGDAVMGTKDRTYVQAVFGQGNKDPQVLPASVFKSFGCAEGGFDVGSAQFAIHYFFENEIVLHNFLRNVSDCIRVGGYFVGTTYDGQAIFEKLRKKQKGDAWTIMRNGAKLAEITKDYDHTEFPDDEASIGYQISVYQETINQVFPEYLVNFAYLKQLMNQYGFQLVGPEEAQKMGLPSATGMFEDLYKKMVQDIRGRYVQAEEFGLAETMSPEEKQISFLNRYFVFKKTHSVDTENLYKIVRNRQAIKMGEEAVKQAESVVVAPPSGKDEPPKTVIIRTKKLKNKLVIPCGQSK
jgi:mRNA (guanine-N7-)-methyltransferase